LPRSHSHNKDFLDLRGDSRVGTNARPGIPEVEWHRLTRFLPLYVVRARDKRRQRERFYLALYILILGNTGIRVGEALRWRDVSTTRTLTDEVRAILSVRGKTGEREVVCNKGVERYLDELRSFRTEELGLCPPDQEYVFCHSSGAPVGSFKGGFQRALKEAGVLFASDGKKRVPLLAPAHLRHHEARRGGQRLPARGQHGDVGRDAGGVLRQEADARPEDGNRGDEEQKQGEDHVSLGP
jgi:hypothetical protein